MPDALNSFSMVEFYMIKDLSLRGVMGPAEFSAYVRGIEAKGIFYEELASGIRFFSRGNEFTISKDGIHYRGIGGSFCEYMFGVEKPLEDFTNKDVLNRLTLFGTYEKDDRLLFTNNIEGTESFEKIFLQGHAVRNYYFLISSNYSGEPKERQKEILAKIGKLLKRTPLSREGIKSRFIDEFFSRLGEPFSTIFLFELIHRVNREFYQIYSDFYYKDRKLSPKEEEKIAQIAESNSIDYYQQERMKIDIMYRHPENRYIVDEYRDILLSSIGKESIEQSDLARLRRLRTLRIRNNIPGALFEALDEFLLKGKKILETEEPSYLKDARAILENLFFYNPSLKNHIITEDIVRLLRAKHQAYVEGDMGFERILLDIGKACDDAAHQTNDYSLFEAFSAIVTYFDRYDHVQALMSRIAFTENATISSDSLRSLLGNMKEFDSLESGLFEDIFIKSLLSNKYITMYGKKKIKAIYEGMLKISRGDASLRDVLSEVDGITEEEKLYRHVHGFLRDRLRTLYPRLDSKDGKEEIKADIRQELRERGLSNSMPDEIFDRVVIDLKKESFYINHLFPSIIKTADKALREDFLKNSGLDRFYVEGLERRYFEERGLDTFLLELIREDKEPLRAGSSEF